MKMMVVSRECEIHNKISMNSVGQLNDLDAR